MTLVLVLLFVLCSILRSGNALVWAQQPSASTPSPACEAQVTDQYRQLIADRILQEGQLSQWSLQLNAVTSQLRVVTTQYSMKRQQAEQAEGNTAALFEQIRQLQQVNAQLTNKNAELSSEVTLLKQQNPPQQPLPPPAN